MTSSKQNTGFAIAVAWPETYCKQPGYWYDGLMNLLGFSNYHYYKVGHAAVVLINSETSKCHYFDFGRYHTPFQHGRVRSELTDHNLRIKALAKISNDACNILNFEEILSELQLNSECHGEGKLHASYCPVNFDKALKKATQLQMNSPITYGPFMYKGSNCSRFVNTCIVAGKPDWKLVFKLRANVLLTPTPMDNVNSLNNKIVIPKLLKNTPFCPAIIKDKRILKQTLAQTIRPSSVPVQAQWLSGEGSGSWFVIENNSDAFKISRYCPEGFLECQSQFNVSNSEEFNLNLSYRIDHLSHCQKVVFIQNNNRIVFERIENKN
tara:strand:+ start:6610 stop:7578 length:969 start_codon:yes stop_codon:yes gene_type:complete